MKGLFKGLLTFLALLLLPLVTGHSAYAACQTETIALEIKIKNNDTNQAELNAAYACDSVAKDICVKDGCTLRMYETGPTFPNPFTKEFKEAYQIRFNDDDTMQRIEKRVLRTPIASGEKNPYPLSPLSYFECKVVCVEATETPDMGSTESDLLQELGVLYLFENSTY
jgi:hypothetical protein